MIKGFISLTLALSLISIPAQSNDNSISYTPTNKLCNKSKEGKINNKNLICLKNNKKYKWYTINKTNFLISQKNQNIIKDIDLIYNKINDQIKNYTGELIKIKRIYSPNVNTNLADHIINQYEISLQEYSKKINHEIIMVTFNESEYDWYVDHNNGEAQDVVIESIISWYKKEFSKEISKDDYSELFDEIKSNYNL